MNSVHLSGAKGPCVSCLFFFLLTLIPRASDLTICAENKPALVFAGENKSVQLYLKNSANVPRKVKLETRTYQVAATAATPLGERKKWKEISLDPGQSAVEKFPLALPNIRAATTLVLKFYEEGNVVEVGSVPLLVYPQDLLTMDTRSMKKEFAALTK